MSIADRLRRSDSNFPGRRWTSLRWSSTSCGRGNCIGIRSGIVDAIATDHAPHSEEDKLKGMAGMVGSETAFGVCYTKLCREQRIPLEMLSFLMSAGPAAVLGLADRKGLLEPGYDADVVLVDIDHMYEVHADELHSKSKNCPYDGALLYGKVVTTIKGGKVTFQIEE